ncbi:MAG: hypothetical protein ACR2OB_05530 [Solirubrobacteraceae bacterium]
MSSAKLAALSGLVTLGLCACASTAKPLAGTIHPTASPLSRGRIDDPRTARSDHIKCLQQAHLPVVKVGTSELQLGPPPAGPTIDFAPTPGTAQGRQIDGSAQGAEVIGGALLYPNQASDAELGTIETCLAKGVLG